MRRTGIVAVVAALMLPGAVQAKGRGKPAPEKPIWAPLGAELATRVANMNGAAEGKKLDLLAAIVTNMVEQRTAMNMRMGKMQDEMMRHMMQHMQLGKESMSQCPMIKRMKDMDDTSAGEPKPHHEEQK